MQQNNYKEPKICGLDLSTSCVGVSLLNKDGTFHSIHYVDLKKIKNFNSKVDALMEFLIHKLTLPEDVEFYIETPLLAFAMKSSMASTIILLQRFNACVCYCIFKAFGINPIHISAATARKTIGLSIPKAGKKQAKPLVLNFVRQLDMIPEDFWKLKKTGKPKDFCYDAADSFIIALAAFLRYHSVKADIKE